MKEKLKHFKEIFEDYLVKHIDLIIILAPIGLLIWIIKWIITYIINSIKSIFQHN